MTRNCPRRRRVETDHPHVEPAVSGAFIRSEVVEPLGLNVAGAATCFGATLCAAQQSSRSVRHDGVADREAFGVRMDMLMRMQTSYDIARTRQREDEVRVAR